MRLPLGALAAALILYPATPPARAEGLTLSGAFERAISSNLSLERARRELPYADAQRRMMFSALLPRVAAFGNLGLNSTEVSFGEPPDDRTILPREDWDFRLVATQPVFAGLREKRAYDQSKLAVEGARQTGRGAGEDVLLAVATAFAAAAGSEALVEVETRNVALVAQRAKQAKDLFDAGETTRVDLLRAEADGKAAEERLVTARQALEESLGRLRVALALDGEIDVDAGSAQLPELPAEEELLATALARADVKQAELALAAVTLEVKKQKGAYLPVLFAEAGYVKQKRAFPVDEYAYGALRLSVDVFRGGEVAARVAAARERETQARLALEELRREVKESVRVALHAVEASRARTKLADERLAAAEADYDQTFEQYRSQLLTTLDVQSAETSLAEARRGRIAARLGLFLSEVRVLHAAGALAASTLEETSR
ncbi:MAG: TolC family protein [Thermoanaerobaculia bacterium]|nr:TolC family protein [Thermoanaerobaculia bacterium]